MKLNEVAGMATPLTDEDVAQIMAVRADRADLTDELYEKLFPIFMDSGDMPYGTMKARTGDPYNWISDRLIRMPKFELEQLLKKHRGR